MESMPLDNDSIMLPSIPGECIVCTGKASTRCECYLDPTFDQSFINEVIGMFNEESILTKPAKLTSMAKITKPRKLKLKLKFN